jgi:hypothetical protein
MMDQEERAGEAVGKRLEKDALDDLIHPGLRYLYEVRGKGRGWRRTNRDGQDYSAYWLASTILTGAKPAAARPIHCLFV